MKCGSLFSYHTAITYFGF